MSESTLNKRAIYTFSTAHFLNDIMTSGMVPALIVLYKQELHLNYTQASYIVLVSYLASSVMQPLFGMITDRKPQVWLLAIGAFLSCIGLGLTAIAPSLPWLLCFIALSGIGSGAFHPEASRGAHLASGGKKGLAQAIFQVGGNGGQAFGPLVVSLFVVKTGIHGLLWLIPIGLLSLVLTGQILPWLQSKVRENKRSYKSIVGENNIKGVILLVSIIILRSWCQVGVVMFLPFYFSHISIETAEWLNFTFVGAGALGTFIGGLLSDRIGNKKMMLGSMLLAAPFAILFPYTKGILMVADLILFGFAVLSSFAVTVVYMQKLLPKNIAMASGLSIGFGVGAGGVGATLMGKISDLYGVSPVFTLLSFLPLVSALIAIFLPKEKIAFTSGKTTKQFDELIQKSVS